MYGDHGGHGAPWAHRPTAAAPTCGPNPTPRLHGPPAPPPYGFMDLGLECQHPGVSGALTHPSDGFVADTL